MFKKVTNLLFFIALFGFNAMAQDVIITKDGKKINSTVIEVNENDIRYKLFENLTGPTYFLKKSEIASIMYENGYVDVFNMNTSTSTPKTAYSTDTYMQYDMRSAKSLRDAGATLFATGMTFTFPIGFSLLFTSYGYSNYYGYYYDSAQMISGMVFCSIGSTLLIPGIVMWAVGQTRMDRIRGFNPNGFSLFENKKVQLNLAVGGNYMGFKMNF